MDWDRAEKIPKEKIIIFYGDMLHEKLHDIELQIDQLKTDTLRMEILQAISIISPFIAVLILISFFGR